MNKRGLSPIIATLLLIAIAFVLAMIIFFWAKGFIKEEGQKLGKPMEYVCADINFDAEARLDGSKLTVDVVNRGDVPIYGIEVRKKEVGTIEGVKTFEDRSILNGETGQLVEESYNAGAGEIVLVPIIIGEIGDMKKAYTCDEKYGKPFEI